MDLYQFPKVQKTIEDFFNDEDGNITRSQMVTIGALVLVMSIMSAMDTYAKHASHKSHSSHGSTAYIRTHTNHNSHSDHGSHSSHSSHTSHSNTASHSNSIYSSEGDVTYGPNVSSIPGISANTQPNSALTSGDAASTNNVTASIADTAFPTVPNAPDVPGTIIIATLQKTASITPMTVDPNRSLFDDLKDEFLKQY